MLLLLEGGQVRTEGHTRQVAREYLRMLTDVNDGQVELSIAAV
jgi:hypothetical protein